MFEVNKDDILFWCWNSI